MLDLYGNNIPNREEVQAYSWHDVNIYLEELYEASKVYIATKTQEAYYNIVYNLMNEEIYSRYNIDKHKLDHSNDSRSYDLCKLATIWKEIASFSRKYTSIDVTVNVDVKMLPQVQSSIINDLLYVTNRLLIYKYNKL